MYQQRTPRAWRSVEGSESEGFVFGGIADEEGVVLGGLAGNEAGEVLD